MSGDLAIRYVSPSALQTFMPELGGCWRKWAWTKLDRFPKSQTDAALLGGEVHKHHEDYLTTGKPYDLTSWSGVLAESTRHLLPAPMTPGVSVEREATIKIAGVLFGGRIDVSWKQGDTAIILDHKTSAGEQWAKLTKESLLADPQAPIYALIGMRDYGTTKAQLRWNYAIKKRPRPKAVPSWHEVSDVEAYEAVTPYLESALQMAHVVRLANERGLRTLNLPYNAHACDQYGGCPFRDNCKLTRKEVIEQMTQSIQPGTPTFMQRLAQLTPGAAEVQPAAFPSVATAVPPQPAFTAFVPGSAPQHYGSAINPPESVAVAFPPPIPVPTPAPTPSPIHAGTGAPTPPPIVTIHEGPAVTPVATPAATPEAPKRGRPRKATEENRAEDFSGMLVCSVASGICSNPAYAGRSSKELAAMIAEISGLFLSGAA